jgi:hypothetical protein
MIVPVVQRRPVGRKDANLDDDLLAATVSRYVMVFCWLMEAGLGIVTPFSATKRCVGDGVGDRTGLGLEAGDSG